MTEDSESRTPRRRFLAGLGAGSVTGFAGCRSRTSDDGAESATPTATETATDRPSSDAEVTKTEDPTETDAEDTTTDSPTAEATWSEGGPPDREDWTVTFADDFGAGSLDRSKWDYDVGYQYSCPNGSLECFVEDNVWVDADTDRLVIETSDDAPADGEYSAGALNTRGVLEQEFGYFEAKARPPVQPGALPAFWAWWNADDWTYRRELDFYEVIQENPREAIHNVHANCEHTEPGEGPSKWTGGKTTLDGPADERFRVWGCEWAPDSVTFYVDGEAVVHREDDFIGECLAGEAMWVVLTSAVKEQFGDPIAADYPYTHEFDWVRVWQREEWA